MAFNSRLSTLSGKTLIVGGPVGTDAGLLLSDSTGGAGGGGGGGGLLSFLPDCAAAVTKTTPIRRGAKSRVNLGNDISKDARLVGSAPDILAELSR